MEKIFSKYNLHNGRIISHSKSFYRSCYPYNKVCFNAGIFIQENFIAIEQAPLCSNLALLRKVGLEFKERFHTIKVFHGDIDLSLEGDLLVKISKEIGRTLYVLSEFDSTVEEPNLKKAIWSTEEEVPYVTEALIREINQKKELNRIETRLNFIKKMRESLKENKELEITNLETKYIKEIKLPINLIESELKRFKDLFYSFKKVPNREKGSLYNEFFKEYGYFTYGVLDKYLCKVLNIKNLHPSSIWFNRKTNKYLRKIDLEIERLFNPNFNYSDFKRFVTSNYCVPDITFSLNDGISTNSYKDNILYIRDGYER